MSIEWQTSIEAAHERIAELKAENAGQKNAYDLLGKKKIEAETEVERLRKKLDGLSGIPIPDFQIDDIPRGPDYGVDVAKQVLFVIRRCLAEYVADDAQGEDAVIEPYDEVPGDFDAQEGER